MNDPHRKGEIAFETVIETHLLFNGYLPVNPEGFDRERAIFAEMVLAFIQETQPKEWAKLEALHGEKTGEQVISDLCKWMDTNDRWQHCDTDSNAMAGPCGWPFSRQPTNSILSWKNATRLTS